MDIKLTNGKKIITKDKKYYDGDTIAVNVFAKQALR